MSITELRQIAFRLGGETRRPCSHPVIQNDVVRHCLEALLDDSSLSADEKDLVWGKFEEGVGA